MSHHIKVFSVVVRLDSELPNLIRNNLSNKVLQNHPIKLPWISLELLEELLDGLDVRWLWLYFNHLDRLVFDLFLNLSFV